MEKTKRMIAFRNEVMDELVTAKECFAKHLISDNSVIAYLASRDVARLKVANKSLNKKRNIYDIFEFIAEKYCISFDTVVKYYYNSAFFIKRNSKQPQ